MHIREEIHLQLISIDVQTSGEQNLLSKAFDPQFHHWRTNGLPPFEHRASRSIYRLFHSEKQGGQNS